MKMNPTSFFLMALLCLSVSCSKNDHPEEPAPPPPPPEIPEKNSWKAYSTNTRNLGQINWSFAMGDSIYFAKYRSNIIDIYKVSTKEWKTTITLPQDFHERSGPAVVVHGNKVFIGGGMYDILSFRDWWEFTPSSNSWKQLADCPIDHWMGVSYILGNKLVAGLSMSIMDGPLIQPAFIKYDLQTNTWDATPVNTTANCGSFGFTFTIGNKMYFGAGYGPGDEGMDQTTNCQTLDMTNLTIQTFPAFPVKNVLGVNANSFVADGKAYVITFDSKLYQFDPATGNWNAMKDSPRDKDNSNVHYLHKVGEKVLGFTEYGAAFEYFYQ